MPVLALVQFSGTPNTEQYRIGELLSLASNPEVLRDAKIHNIFNNKQQQSNSCTCCCRSQICSEKFPGNAVSNNVNRLTNNNHNVRNNTNLIKIIGGCPTICSIHTLRRKQWCTSSSEEEEEVEGKNTDDNNNNDLICGCASCHLPSFSNYFKEEEIDENEPEKNNNKKRNLKKIFSRMFRAFFTNNTSTLFVEFASFSLMEEVSKRSMMIANIYLVAGIGQDDKIPLPKVKEYQQQLKDELFGPGASLALQDSFSSPMSSIVDQYFVSSSSSSLEHDDDDDKYHDFIKKSHHDSPSFTFRLEYSSPAKYSAEVAKGFVDDVLVKDSTLLTTKRYNFRTPDSTYMMVIVPPPGLLSLTQMLTKKSNSTTIIQDAADAKESLLPSRLQEDSSSSPASPSSSILQQQQRQQQTFYLQTILFSTTPRCLLMNLYSVKLRRYIGTTTMVPELSFLLNNCGRVKKGDLVLDPFCGTGSLLMAARHLGAQTIGFDIDGRVMRKGTKDSAQSLQASEFRFNEAKKKIPQILATEDAKKFLSQKQLDLLLVNSDVDENGDNNFVKIVDANPQASFRQNFNDFNLGFGPNSFVGSFSAFSKSFGASCHNRPWLDAIITDPPYGLRETKRKTEETKIGNSETKSSDARDQLRPLDSHPLYEATELLVDLICFAAVSLVEGGRLVFWMSVTSYDYDDRQLPRHPLMKLISNIPQQLNSKTVRRLVVMEKIKKNNNKGEDDDDVGEIFTLQSSRQHIFENTMKGLELRKAVDLPVFVDGEEDNNNNNNNNNNNDHDDRNDELLTKNEKLLLDDDDVNAADVRNNIAKAKRKKWIRQENNEAAAQWRRENNFHGNNKNLNNEKDGAVEVEVNEDSFSLKKKSKAELRQMNVENRERNIRKREEEAQQKQQSASSGGKPKTPPKPE